MIYGVPQSLSGRIKTETKISSHSIQGFLITLQNNQKVIDELWSYNSIYVGLKIQNFIEDN